MAALGDALADQIAAGEVVERPASVVKELVDNAIDAGARRIDVRLTQGGTASIVVTDDGHGIHPEDLTLALQRHATSKLRRAEDLDTIETLGFRGEALASIAAVARVKIASRRLGESVGQLVRCRPGGVLSIEPAGMAVGTRIEVLDLFANVPARRKFLRTEATEVGHVSEALVRLAIVHPQVRFSLIHGRRTLLELSPSDQASRVCELLRRRGGTDPMRYVHCERDGVAVDAWLMTPCATTRRGGGVTVVVRRRVVREANIAKIVSAAHTATHAGGDGGSLPGRLAPGTQPVACVWVEPPPHEVDINVHPQKVEIRFGDPQRVYAAVREAMASLEAEARRAVPAAHENSRQEQQAPAASDLARPSLADALSGWTEGTPSRADTRPAPRSTASRT
ncbi:MAG: DNA mismatch repair endonuclease MutL [Nannocystaceae bacterium]|nr:DNA mismatch repair endonuclease MutL [Nannocystaceae bacterium]